MGLTWWPLPPHFISSLSPLLPLLSPLSSLHLPLLSTPLWAHQTDHLIASHCCTRQQQQHMVGWANRLPQGCDVARQVTGGRLSTRLVVGVVVGVLCLILRFDVEDEVPHNAPHSLSHCHCCGYNHQHQQAGLERNPHVLGTSRTIGSQR